MISGSENKSKKQSSKKEQDVGDADEAEDPKSGSKLGVPGSMVRRKSSNIRGDMPASAANDSITEAKNKLEQDYIQMYLGELSPMQESQLVQLKSWVSDLLKGKVII